MVKALADVVPDQAAGASYGDSMVIGIAGIDHRNGRPWFDLEPTVGGWGAWRGSDGEDGLINNVNGSLKDLPIEVSRPSLRCGSPTTGPCRLGRRRTVARRQRHHSRVHARRRQAELFLWFERSVTPAWGLFGGNQATPPVVVVNPGRSDERRMLKTSRFVLRRGDAVRTMTGGGGGFGPPAEREARLVEVDVRNRHLTPQKAREVYGVECGYRFDTPTEKE